MNLNKSILCPRLWLSSTVPMSSANKYWQAVKKSLQEGDFEKTKRSLEGMQKALADLEGFKLHKNAERMEEFQEQANNFKKNLSELGKAIKEKDKARTQSISVTIDNSCVHCHSVFRYSHFKYIVNRTAYFLPTFEEVQIHLLPPITDISKPY